MDQFMVDVTEIPDVKTGDEVTLLGKMGMRLSVQIHWEICPAVFLMNLYVISANVCQESISAMGKSAAS